MMRCFWHSDFRGDAFEAQANDRNWREAHSLAHHENLFGTWCQRLHYLLRLQGIFDQGVFRELFSAHVGCDF